MRKPGPLNHARWVTLTNRVCWLYISTDSAMKNLYTITHFMVTNYAPNWFSIKQSPLCTDGAKHFYLAIQLVKVLSSDIRPIVEPYIGRNAYCAHAENILIAMLADSNKHTRQRAVERILHCRLTASTNNTVRQFKVPNIDFNASD